MSRMWAALIAGGFVVCFPFLAAHTALAGPEGPSPASSPAEEQGPAEAESARKPARQVPVEPYEGGAPAAAGSGGQPEGDSVPAVQTQKPAAPETPESAEAMKDGPAPETGGESAEPSGEDAEKAQGGEQPIPGKTPETAAKTPARQVPLSGEEMLSGERETSAAGAGGTGPETPSAGKSDGAVARQIPAGEEEPAAPPAEETRTAKPAPEPETSPAGLARGDKPVEEARPRMAVPGLPVRKPPVPVARAAREESGGRDMRKEERPPPQEKKARGSREEQLCKALKACRHQFIRCKSRITHPDQSEAWSVAKEKCGAEYNACVEKDFRPGEWFFTRWFHFWELECG